LGLKRLKDMARFHNIDGVEVPFTPEEESARDIVEAEYTAGALGRAQEKAKNLIDKLRENKKKMSILSEGEQIDAGTLNSGAMANELFAYDGKNMAVVSINRVDTIATAVFSKNHHAETGQTLTFAGAGEAEYVGGMVITAVIDKKTLTFTVAGTPATPATGAITALPSTFQWIDAQNNTVFWSADKIKDIHRDATKYERECVKHARDLKDDVLACGTIEELNAININTGWPVTGL
jgi:hypothetical protein